MGIVVEMAVDGFPAVGPGHPGERFLVGAAVLLVQLFDLEEDLAHDVAVGQGDAGGIDGLVAPLLEAAAVGEAPLLLDGGGAGQHEDLGLDLGRIHARAPPEGTGLVVEEVDVDHPVQLPQGGPDLVGVGAAAGGIHSPGEEPGELAFVHLVEDHQPGIVGPVVHLGHHGVRLFRRRIHAVHGPQETGRVFRVIFPPVQAVLFLRGRGFLLIVFLQRLEGSRRRAEIPRPDMEEESVVRRSLNVGLAAHGRDAAAGDAHVSQQKLDHAHGPDHLGAHGVLCPAHGVQLDARLVRLARGCVELVDLDQLVLGRAGDFRNDLGRVARVLLFQELIDAVGILKGRILQDDPVGAGLIGPGILAVFAALQAGENAVVVPGKLEGRVDQEGGVGVVLHVGFLDQVVVDDVLDHAPQERDVRSGTKGCVEVGLRRGLGEPGVYADHFRAPVHGSLNPLEGDRVVGSGVASHDEDHVTVLEIDPVIRHCAASERLSQSRYSRAVSDPGLVFNIDQTQPP